MSRKVIQIATSSAGTYLLCNDGTLWGRAIDGAGYLHWIEVVTPPGCGEASEQEKKIRKTPRKPRTVKKR